MPKRKTRNKYKHIRANTAASRHKGLEGADPGTSATLEFDDVFVRFLEGRQNYPVEVYADDEYQGVLNPGDTMTTDAAQTITEIPLAQNSISEDVINYTRANKLRKTVDEINARDIPYKEKRDLIDAAIAGSESTAHIRHDDEIEGDFGYNTTTKTITKRGKELDDFVFAPEFPVEGTTHRNWTASDGERYTSISGGVPGSGDPPNTRQSGMLSYPIDGDFEAYFKNQYPNQDIEMVLRGEETKGHDWRTMHDYTYYTIYGQEEEDVVTNTPIKRYETTIETPDMPIIGLDPIPAPPLPTPPLPQPKKVKVPRGRTGDGPYKKKKGFTWPKWINNKGTVTSNLVTGGKNRSKSLYGHNRSQRRIFSKDNPLDFINPFVIGKRGADKRGRRGRFLGLFKDGGYIPKAQNSIDLKRISNLDTKQAKNWSDEDAALYYKHIWEPAGFSMWNPTAKRIKDDVYLKNHDKMWQYVSKPFLDAVNWLGQGTVDMFSSPENMAVGVATAGLASKIPGAWNFLKSTASKFKSGQYTVPTSFSSASARVSGANKGEIYDPITKTWSTNKEFVAKNKFKQARVTEEINKVNTEDIIKNSQKNNKILKKTIDKIKSQPSMGADDHTQKELQKLLFGHNKYLQNYTGPSLKHLERELRNNLRKIKEGKEFLQHLDDPQIKDQFFNKWLDEVNRAKYLDQFNLGIHQKRSIFDRLLSTPDQTFFDDSYMILRKNGGKIPYGDYGIKVPQAQDSWADTEGQSVINWYQNLIASPKTQERAEAIHGEFGYQELQNERQNRLLGHQYDVIPQEEWDAIAGGLNQEWLKEWGETGNVAAIDPNNMSYEQMRFLSGMMQLDQLKTMYTPVDNISTISIGQLHNQGNNPKSGAANEVSHATGALPIKWQDKYGIEYGLSETEIGWLNETMRPGYLEDPDVDDHDKKEYELKSDYDTFRFELANLGIYDAGTEDFTTDHLNQALELYQSDPGKFARLGVLLKAYTDENIILNMNRLVRTTDPKGSPFQQTDDFGVQTEMVRYGGKVERYRNGKRI